MLKRFSLALLVAVLALLTGVVTAIDGETTWMPIGGFYTTFPDFVTQVAKAAGEDRVYILVVPASFSYDSTTLTTDDLLLNTKDAERRRRQLEDVCREMVTDKYCEVVLIPLYTREAALSESALEYVPEDLAGVYFLGGDQVIAMEVLANTPLEAALGEAFKRGVPMGGNSAGLAIASRTMIAGYAADEFGPQNSLIEGSVDIWNTDEKRGLDFGVTSVVLEQHFWERSRLPRMLNAIVQDGVPPVGIGVDSLTGGLLHNDTVFEGLFGLYGAAVVDAATYGAVETVTYDNPNKTLSVRNLLLHTLAPGDFSYDTVTRQHSLAAPEAPTDRAYTGFNLPEGAGTLILGGNLFGPLVSEGDQAVLNHFKELAGGETIVIVAAGYADADTAAGAAEPYQAALGITGDVIVAGAETTLPDDVDGIVVIGGDQSLIDTAALAGVAEAWRAGTPLLMDGAAAAAAGTFYAAVAPTPYDSEDDVLIEEYTQASFVQGKVEIKEGLGLINAIVEPRVMDDNRWGRVISVAYNHPDLLAVALADDTALEVTAKDVTVHGNNGVFVFDLRSATLDLGTNEGFVIANALLDVFAAGETLAAAPIESK